MDELIQLPNGWTNAVFEDVLDYIQPTNYIVDSTEYNDTYKIPVLTAGKSFIIGYTNETHCVYNELPVIIFDDFTTSTKFVNYNTPQKLDRGIRWMIACHIKKEAEYGKEYSEDPRQRFQG